MRACARVNETRRKNVTRFQGFDLYVAHPVEGRTAASEKKRDEKCLIYGTPFDPLFILVYNFHIIISFLLSFLRTRVAFRASLAVLSSRALISRSFSSRVYAKIRFYSLI